jgi:hypothetical protein
MFSYLNISKKQNFHPSINVAGYWLLVAGFSDRKLLFDKQQATSNKQLATSN